MIADPTRSAQVPAAADLTHASVLLCRLRLARIGEPVPKSALPPRNYPVVTTDRAMPVDAIVLVHGRIRNHDTRARTMPGPATATHGGQVVDTRRSIHNDAGKVFSEPSSARRHLCHGAAGRQVVPKIGDPSVTHIRSVMRPCRAQSPIISSPAAAPIPRRCGPRSPIR